MRVVIECGEVGESRYATYYVCCGTKKVRYLEKDGNVQLVRTDAGLKISSR